ncbi:guanylyl cyclase [Desulfosarcina widdelii]|uniref:Guanylyl cyclase n=1 Tax=Desulfosarcina widdelii TaxID=947919 RepID=A0A5K7ZPL5_9BACT|nr:adenylate/guanylate cyclase domain-containing protein [Desulfosarcina widdelii]BBO78527.1 guanylyl cyclase [Desulfosarcina widdelii]
MAENGTQRKLTAILSADVKGYSKLMGDDDESTVNTITAYRAIIADLIQNNQGRVVDTPGDNILAEFNGALNAVNSAIEIQKRLEIENGKLQSNRRMNFRIGINLGDVLHKDNRIYGDGVNVAARIESLADPGGISISRGVFDQVKNKVRQGFEYMGEHEVKNISEPVRIYRVLLKPEFEGKIIDEQSHRKTKLQKPYAIAIVLILICSVSILWVFYPRPAKIQAASIDKMAYPLPEKPSIVVLPFKNMSDNPEEDYFSDGLTEQIITTLSTYPRIFVITRQSAFHYKEQSVEIRQVAEELGVHYVLTGGVQKSGNKVRITVQLIDAISGSYIWSERYDRRLTDIFEIQDEITANVLNAMVAQLTEGEQARRWTQKKYNLKALEKHYRAQGFFCRHTREDYEKALPLFEESIELEPDFVWPYVYLGYTHLNLGVRGWSESPKESFKAAFELAQKALNIDELHDGAHSLLAAYYNVTRQYEKALSEIDRAIELNSNAADAKAIKGGILSNLGLWEDAARYGEMALRLNPFPGVFVYWILGRAYFMTGQYDESIAICKKAIQVSPNFIAAHRYLAACYSSLDREADAQAAAKEVLRINPKFSIESYAKRLRYKNKADIERELGALRKAGLPEKSTS